MKDVHLLQGVADHLRTLTEQYDDAELMSAILDYADELERAAKARHP